MTPTEAREFMDGTFGPARARTVITKLADQVEALTEERDELLLQIDIQAGSIEAVQAANQRLAEECEALIFGVDQWKVDFHELSLERDALAANHRECVRCLGGALQDRADLAAAAKLALDALYAYEPSITKFGLLFGTGAKAIDAIRQAGVQ